MFKATAAERANPFLSGNADGSYTPEQQARFGAGKPGERASAAVTKAMQYVDQACTDCHGKYTAIDNAVVALQEARVLYQDDPGSVRQIDQQIDQLKGGITKNELARGMAGAISDKDKGIAALLLGAPSRVIAGASTVAVEQAASTELAAATRASVDDKLARYLLNADHPIGGSKAQWFESALGFNAGNAEQLAKQIVFNESAAVQTSVIEEGVKI